MGIERRVFRRREARSERKEESSASASESEGRKEVLNLLTKKIGPRTREAMIGADAQPLGKVAARAHETRLRGGKARISDRYAAVTKKLIWNLHECYTSSEKDDTSEIDLAAEFVDLEVKCFPPDLFSLDESSVPSLLFPDEQSDDDHRGSNRHDLIRWVEGRNQVSFDGEEEARERD